MLNSIVIQNIALISKLTVDFSKGLNIITGETGAGKSIIIDSINLVLGDRAGRDIIKTGEQKASVEAVFDISGCEEAKEAIQAEAIDCDDDILIISRELYAKDNSATVRSVCRINGTVVSLSSLKSVTEHIVDVHGQHEHQSLLAQPKHMKFLDDYAADEVKQLKDSVRSIYKRYKEVERSLNSGFMSERERAQRIDILSYQVQEIEAVSPQEGEDDALGNERKLLANSENIMRALYSASEMLTNGDGGALTVTKSACNELYPISELSEEYSALASALNEAYYALEAAAYSVRDCSEAFTFDAQRLDEVESRLSAISSLKRKYGGTIEEILKFQSDAQNELDALIHDDELRSQRQTELNSLAAEYARTAEKLSSLRKKAADKFSRQVTENLDKLGLKKASFSVSLTRLEGEIPSSDGVDFIEFMFSANPGEPEKPLRKVASGGEISRIMLALKSVLSDCEDIGTMIFDEIDTGISGNTATVVGAQMRAISRKKQVLAITHLPQIAAYADSHYIVEKIQTANSTTSVLRRLTDDERAGEVARIMGGADSELAINHARELIKKATSNE